MPKSLNKLLGLQYDASQDMTPARFQRCSVSKAVQPLLDMAASELTLAHHASKELSFEWTLRIVRSPWEMRSLLRKSKLSSSRTSLSGLKDILDMGEKLCVSREASAGAGSSKSRRQTLSFVRTGRLRWRCLGQGGLEGRPKLACLFLLKRR